jgi:hypothetical protein
MSEATPGATSIIDAPLPTDPAAAQSKRDQLVGDIEFMKDWCSLLI